MHLTTPLATSLLSVPPAREVSIGAHLPNVVRIEARRVTAYVVNVAIGAQLFTLEYRDRQPMGVEVYWVCPP